ncbi:DDB1- and CUL4-associated factor 8 [Geodia barretti]|uniref:DDB1- and CUL4-associated factor 8 n=1 Tax=Geodia barretti TaxID=519541 RepID=A0AA35WQA2_GEOBA|nr:DDB1- and CUL4-associated factor 8 [Geodia barretti]
MNCHTMGGRNQPPACSPAVTSYLPNLGSRQLSHDPLQGLSRLQEQCYGLPSVVRRLSLQHRLEAHEGCVNCINFSGSGQLLASGSDDLHVVVWDWERGRMVSKLESGHISNIFQAKFMPYTGESVLVTAARDGQVRCLILSSTGSLVASKRVALHNDSAHKIALEPYSPDMFLSCGEDGSVLEVDLREEAKRNKLLVVKNEKRSRIPLYSIFIDPCNTHLFAVSGRDQFARVYDRRKLKQDHTSDFVPLKKFCPKHLTSPENEHMRANVTCLVYSHNGDELLCSYNDEDIYLFNTRDESKADDFIKRYQGHRNSATVKGVNFFGLRSEYVVSGSDCGHVFLWDKTSQQVVQMLEGDHEGVVNCLEPHPHTPVLATSGLDHDIKIWSPCASQPTSLDQLDEVTKRNCNEREDAMTHPMDGYEMLMQFIVRQYRRGIRVSMT